MKEHIDYLSTLFVGIDIASRIHVVSALDFNQKFFIKMKPVENTQEGAALIEQMISDVLEYNHQFKFVVIAMEATGFYGVHLANYLSASGLLTPFSIRVYCLNPKEVKNYKKSFNDIGKKCWYRFLCDCRFCPCRTYCNQTLARFPIPCPAASYQTPHAYH